MLHNNDYIGKDNMTSFSWNCFVLESTPLKHVETVGALFSSISLPRII